MRIFIFLLLALLCTSAVYTQSVGISETGNIPDPSALLDLVADDKGMLVPRLTSAQRSAIPNPAAGLLVYDTNESEFWYYTGTAWTSIVQDQVNQLSDTDNDTKIQVEEVIDEDVIRFDVAGTESMTLQRNTNGQTLLQLNLGNSNLFLGNSAGQLTSSGGFNSFLGQMAGSSNTTGHSNVFLGYEAGEDNVVGHSNIFVGRAAGLNTTDGTNNVFIGRGAGLFNVTGISNIYLSRNAGYNNTEGNNNIAIGFEAGRQNTSGSGNIFLGYEAGYNEMGSNRLYIENSDSSSPLLYGEFDNDLLRVNGTLNVNNAYSLPSSDGNAGEVLGTDGAGSLSWVQGGAIGGSAALCHIRDDAMMAAQGYCFAGEFQPTLANSWVEIDSLGTNVPSPRINHKALWTGSQMMIWGGQFSSTIYNNGGLYDPITDTWTGISSTNAPSARFEFSMIEIDNKVYIWGGASSSTTVLGDGKIYDLSTDTWTNMASLNAPAARRDHTVIWTGSRMIIWGGLNSTSEFNDGASYDPITDTWTALSTTAAPDPRGGHSAVWSGTEMIVWGGEGALSLGEPFPNGGRYNPTTDTWSAMASVSASSGRNIHDAYWIGDKMLVWEGVDQNLFSDPSGELYDPVSDTWTNMADGGFDDEVNIESVWTGTELLVFGENELGEEVIDAYDPSTDTWDQGLSNWRYNARRFHSLVWADGKMIVWGGDGDLFAFDSGGIFYNTHLYIYIKF